MSELEKLARAQKLDIAKAIDARLQKRIDSGAPAEPALDGFHAEIKAVAVKLSTHVDGVAAVKGSRAALLAASDESDDVVDCWLRKIYWFLSAEAQRRTGALAARAGELVAAAFPDGLDHIDDRIADENEHCRQALHVLKAKDNAATVTDTGLPLPWLAAFEAAIAKSDADFKALAMRRSEKSTQIDLAQDAEEEWVDLMIRFRFHIAGRAKKTDAVKKNEGRELIDPLVAAVKKMRAEAEARATLRAKAKAAANAGGQPSPEAVTEPAKAQPE